MTKNRLDALEGLDNIDAYGELVPLEIDGHLESAQDIETNKRIVIAVGAALSGLMGTVKLLAGCHDDDLTRGYVVICTRYFAFSMSPRCAEIIAGFMPDDCDPEAEDRTKREVAKSRAALLECIEAARKGLTLDD